MRVGLAAMMPVVVLVWSGAAHAQDLCSNIRLSVSEQLECRGRVTNALGDADRQRIQQEFEDRIRRAQDKLITPPVLRSNPPQGISAAPTTGRPIVPLPPPVPGIPGSPDSSAPGSSSPARSSGDIAEPGGAPPSGNAVVPDLTAPNPNKSPLPPISPLPANPAGALPPSR